MTTINNVIAPRSKLLVIMYPKIAVPKVNSVKITSKAFFNLRSLLTYCVRKADVNANVTTAPTIIVTTFPEITPLKSNRNPKITQISKYHPLGNFLTGGTPNK